MKKAEKDKIIVKCNDCGKVVNGRVPKGGDGSLYVPVWHKDNEGKPCEGRFFEGKAIRVTED